MTEAAHFTFGTGPGRAAESPRITPAEMWDNLCRADELLEECEALASTLDARGQTSALPRTGEPPSCDPAG